MRSLHIPGQKTLQKEKETNGFLFSNFFFQLLLVGFSNATGWCVKLL